MGSIFSEVLSLEEVKCSTLIEALGGEDWLSLMMGARDFEPYYRFMKVGLQFTFGEPAREAQLIPRAVGSSSYSFYTVEPAHCVMCYQLVVAVAAEKRTMLDLFKPSWNQIVIDDLAKLVPTLEEVAGVVLSFG